VAIRPEGIGAVNTGQSESWLLLQSGPGDSAVNMAVDELMLTEMPNLGRPVLRLYGWTEPAATFGYFQRYTDVARMTRLRPLIRRPTGGGLVPHDADWTYSAALPATHEWYALRAPESYRRLHEWLRNAFQRTAVTTSLAPVRNKDSPGQCFVGAEQSDLLFQGRKIAGAAQRRNRQGLLIQGSVQPPPGVARQDWETALCDVAAREWGVAWTPWTLPGEWFARVTALAREKYSSADYNQHRLGTNGLPINRPGAAANPTVPAE
jgi:lipoyl(octanoyl) transferase